MIFSHVFSGFLIALGCTIGQLITNIRVRRFKYPQKKICFVNAVLRMLSKVLLGWLSFIVITFNENRRAIHDYFSGSIVVSLEAKNEEQN